MRRYAMQQVYNMRDLGGYPTLDGRATRYGRFIRSDAPGWLSAEEAQRLLALGLSTVIDLRSKGETGRTPSAFLSLAGIDYHHYQLDDGIAWPLDEEDIPLCYFEMATGPAMPTVLRTCAAASGAVLFNCSAGKDRTGVTAALLLSLAGVPEADIIADYEVSYTYLQDKLRAMQKDNPTIFAYVGHSRPEYMASFLQTLNRRYGSTEDFLLQIGLTPNEIAALKQKLLD